MSQKAKEKGPGLDNTCDGGLLSSTNHTHIFFSCSRLSNYWSHVFDVMFIALNVSLKPSPLISIFGVMEDSGAVDLTSAKADVLTSS